MAKAAHTGKITHASVRMYCMGTGDCFIIKLFSGETESCKIMIDCGVWTGSEERLRPYIVDLKKYVNNEVDILIITHEHLDHVSVFNTCSELFTSDFKVGKIWMGWSEDDALPKIKRWKTEHGEKKIALALAAEKLESAVNNRSLEETLKMEMNGMNVLAAKKAFAASLTSFANLHVTGKKKKYKGLLEGMRIVKEEIASDNIEYFYPGDVIEDIPKAKGVKFYVLGPPQKWGGEVATEGGDEGESYTHNKYLKGTDAFAASVLSAESSADLENILPFDSEYEMQRGPVKSKYKNKDDAWRQIDDDWLFSAGSLALRINTLTNNLSLALAIEFEDSKRVMLFPGDAEYGSWSSWHRINWQDVKPVTEGIHFTEDLLRRTVFYKVAHHMSHNGTAKRLGLNMMQHKDLAAMATLNYDSIAPDWKNTMPNREMLQELLTKTKGRIMISKDNDLFYDFKGKEPLSAKLKEAQKKMSAKEATEFKNAFKREKKNLYVDFIVKGTND
jgi:hypothetical protein